MGLNREQFNTLKNLPFFKGKVVTGSMIPIIEIGQEIVVNVGDRKIKRFDIIVFYDQEKLICHFLWNLNRRVEPLLLQTRNMAGVLDHPVSMDDYLGKVVSHRLNLWHKLKILYKSL